MKEMIVKGLHKVGYEFAKNSPGILTGMAVGGVPTVAVLSFKAGMNVKDQLIEQDISDENLKGAAKVALPYLIVPSGVTLATMGCIIAAATVTARRQAAVASLYALSEQTLKDVEEKYISQNSEKKLDKLHDEINADKVMNNPPREDQIIITGAGESLCYDSLSGRYFKTDIERIRRIQNTINEKINAGEYISVNDYSDMLGLPDTELGWDLGWSMNGTGQMDIRFTSCITPDGTPALVIEHKVKPEVKYDYDM